MKLKELLLNGLSFNEILRQFSVDHTDIVIRDEEVIFSQEDSKKKEFLKEKVCIQGKSSDEIINLFGTLHCNFFNQLAVFELDFVERNNGKTVLN